MELALPKLESRSVVKSTLLIVLMTALTAVSAKASIEVPFSPVPITLQSFFVLLSGALLGSKRGAASQLLLIGLGLSGLPVFSRPLPGFLVLVGPTGGYILGFVLAAFVAGLLFERLQPKKIITSFGLFLFSSAFIFIPGAIWLSTFTGMDLTKAIMLGVFPFLVGDLLKCGVSAVFWKAFPTETFKN